MGEKRFCLGSINRDDLLVGRDGETADLCDDHLLGYGQAGFGQGFLIAAVVILGVPVDAVVVLLHEYHCVGVRLDWKQENLVNGRLETLVVYPRCQRIRPQMTIGSRKAPTGRAWGPCG